MNVLAFWDTETMSTAISPPTSFAMARAPFSFRSNSVRLWSLLLLLLNSQALQAQTSLILTDSLATHVLLQHWSGEEGYASAGLLKKARQSPVFMGTALVVVGSGVWTATFALADEPLQQYVQSHRSHMADKMAYMVQPLGRQQYMAPLAGAAFAGGLLLNNSKLQKAGLVSLGSILVSAGITDILKNQFHRHRPSATTENHIFDGPVREADNTSLPSAHTATAFAVATSVATVYGYKYRYVPPIAFGVATLVGASRINDNVHWATDVMAGALVGYLSAKGTIYLYDLADQKLKIRRQRLLITPQPGIRSGGVSATLIF